MSPCRRASPPSPSTIPRRSSRAWTSDTARSGCPCSRTRWPSSSVRSSTAIRRATIPSSSGGWRRETRGVTTGSSPCSTTAASIGASTAADEESSMPIPLSRPPVDDEIKQAVIKAVESGQYILGPECRAFEDEFAAYNGAKHAVLTSSATAAIWMLVKAFGAGTGDEVLVPAHTAFPTVEAICFAGATPVFVDVDETYTVDVSDAAAKITPRTVGFVPVHLYGQPADLPGIQALCEKHGLWLLEDCAQA